MKKDLFGICPFLTGQKVLQGKWSILILHHLSEGPVRFNALQRKLPEMTHATLTKQLRRLEDFGLILRREYDQLPPKVEYSLSEIGRAFGPVLDSFEAWGNQYIECMHRAGKPAAWNEAQERAARRALEADDPRQPPEG